MKSYYKTEQTVTLWTKDASFPDPITPGTIEENSLVLTRGQPPDFLVNAVFRSPKHCLKASKYGPRILMLRTLCGWFWNPTTLLFPSYR